MIASRWKVEVLTVAVHGLVGIILLREIGLILFRRPLWFAFCRYVVDVDVLACWFIKTRELSLSLLVVVGERMAH